ncbi:MAG: hypothetical protein ACD_30C00028G0004 [uncultured bacterium]|uniref:SprT-like domain-containing protein n=3 Tax=Candidatus Daviesiibacteriota TaxID=1752718 RepID=A0A0G0HCI6_9BACT|nr:MAG: hypothetical protein ACD_30C00028G0004 [uncultured bacterium]KKQ09819.1 MAG: hypothetical protein US19_C0011G0022 [Candidatus Daviesbacteria bacterium GW2011_GWB1_36_5]KKQ14076.1 MAG: hypothetical protein US28_C0040G0017 [Candidatus Daviesbacteria bacterium GW2011_GWA1_36_8]OGE35572.1 MAG: hypothetical protein A3E66_02350 [Candidatus Daviesbacteria bacterium RIFCSPHIGHO2_12_FULL_37_16]
MPKFISQMPLSGSQSSESRTNRDNFWLLSRLDHLWSNYFTNVTQDNPIFIKFGRHSRFRLGSIKFDPRTKHSYITITSMFKDLKIPTEVVDHTIAHELCHYTHGFSSPKQKMHRYPHHGGVIKKELAQRGLQHLSRAYSAWIKVYRKQLR